MNTTAEQLIQEELGSLKVISQKEKIARAFKRGVDQTMTYLINQEPAIAEDKGLHDYAEKMFALEVIQDLKESYKI